MERSDKPLLFKQYYSCSDKLSAYFSQDPRMNMSEPEHIDDYWSSHQIEDLYVSTPRLVWISPSYETNQQVLIDICSWQVHNDNWFVVMHPWDSALWADTMFEQWSQDALNRGATMHKINMSNFKKTKRAPELKVATSRCPLSLK